MKHRQLFFGRLEASGPDVFFQTTNLVLSERFHPTNSQNKLFLEDNELQSLSLEESMTSVVAVRVQQSDGARRSNCRRVEGT